MKSVAALKKKMAAAKSPEERMYCNACIRRINAPEGSADKKAWLHIASELKRLLG